MNTRTYFWQDWLAAITKHLAVPQSSEVGGVVRVWFYDRLDEHSAEMWRGDVPYTLIDTYSQAANDSDLAAYDAMVAAESFNKPIDQLNYEGRQIIQPVTLGSGQWHYWHGEGDDVANGTVRGGVPFEASVNTATEQVVEWEYRDPVWIAAGWFKYQGALQGDYVRFTIFAPATAITPNGSNTGNCNLVSSVYIVPAAGGNTGAYDVDLELANPIPTSDAWPYTGYWDYELPADMKYRGTLTPGIPEHSKYILLSIRADLDCFVGNSRLLGDGKDLYNPDNIKVSLCLPGWKFECVVHNENGTNTLQAIWEVLVSRYWTT
jgi:hypothetical protein